MKRILKALFGLFVLSSGAVYADETLGQEVYYRSQATTYKGAAPNFTGDVSGERLFPIHKDTNYTGSYVTFAPGARTAWHTHPAGQAMIVISGTCWTQEWNGKKVEAKAGDAVWCPPGVKHWHGASADSTMTHLVLTAVKDGQNVTWMEPVTDEQYLGE